MKEKKITTTFQIFENIDELPGEEQTLMGKACAARDKAYAPYSNFLVGAAILLENGETVTGSNQENAAYPSGLCAERTAIFYAGAQYPNQKILKMAVSVKSTNKKLSDPAPPCGACRQVIAEYEFKQKSPIQIFFTAETGKVVKAASLADILPLAFDSSFM